MTQGLDAGKAPQLFGHSLMQEPVGPRVLKHLFKQLYELWYHGPMASLPFLK